MPDQKYGTFDDIIEMTPAHLRPVTVRLRDLVLSVHPQTCMIVHLGYRAATFGLGPKKMSEAYCNIIPHGEWVNLGFSYGADLPDPAGLLTGTGAKMRHVKIRALEDCGNPEIITLIENAYQERKAALRRS